MKPAALAWIVVGLAAAGYGIALFTRAGPCTLDLAFLGVASMGAGVFGTAVGGRKLLAARRIPPR